MGAEKAILMKKTKRKVPLPIGRTALLAYTVQALRHQCCEAAEALVSQKRLDEAELEECARLDDALAAAHQILKTAVARVTMARLQRRSKIQ